jgi:predicted nucleotidyltransferase
VLREVGFDDPHLTPDLFCKENQVIRLGNPPLRIELITSISGVSFEACFACRKSDVVDGVDVNIIGLDDLKANKAATGRHKDLDDLDNLP